MVLFVFELKNATRVKLGRFFKFWSNLSQYIFINPYQERGCDPCLEQFLYGLSKIVSKFLHFIILFSQGLAKLSALVRGEQLDSWKQPGPNYIFTFCFKDCASSANNNGKAVYESPNSVRCWAPLVWNTACVSPGEFGFQLWKKKYPTGNNFSGLHFENQIKEFFFHYFLMNIMLFCSCKGWNKEREYHRRSSDFNRPRRVCVCKTNKPLQKTEHLILRQTTEF